MAARSSQVQQTQPPDPNTVEVKPETAPSDRRIQVAAAAYYYKPFLLPPGFRFVPTDEELILYYLNPFLHGRGSLRNTYIHPVNIYMSDPYQLTARLKKGNDKDEWFFIAERSKKYDIGGYWKATGCETKVHAGKDLVGTKRTLDFRIGEQPNGIKSDWIMQEYRSDDPLRSLSSSNKDNKMLDIVLCKIYKSSMGKNRKAEEEQEAGDREFMTKSAVLESIAYYNKPLLLPPGFRFVPKEEELILYYLKLFLHGHSFPKIDIHHVNIYKYNPKQLAAEFKKGNDKDEWFFITERCKRYDRGSRADCSANGGYWKATGCETKVHDARKNVLGSKRTLDFRIGKQPNGIKTDWIMQEYRTYDPLPPSSCNNKSHGENKMLDIVLCKIYRSSMGKNRKAEEEQEVQKIDLPRPSPFDELSWIFYPRQQETSRVCDSTEDHSLNPNLLEDLVRNRKRKKMLWPED